LSYFRQSAANFTHKYPSTSLQFQLANVSIKPAMCLISKLLTKEYCLEIKVPTVHAVTL